MKRNYAIPNIVLNGEWFELDRDNKYMKLGYKALYLYLTLFKFRVYMQVENYFFDTSIAALRKETGYTTEEIFELLKKLKRYKVLAFDGLSRWDMLIDSDGRIKDKDMITCYGIDVPDTSLEGVQFVNVDTKMLQHYQDIGLSERYYPIYCLIRYQADRNGEKKSFTSIQKSAKFLDMDKDTFHRMIHELNRKYLLWSYKRKNSKDGYYFEHRICNTYASIEKWRESTEIMNGIEKNIKDWDKAKDRKERSRQKKRMAAGTK